MVAFHPPQRTQMLQCPAHHAGYRGYCFQHHCTMTVAIGKKRIGKESQKSDESAGNAVTGVPWRVMALK